MPFENAFAITPILRDLPPQEELVVRWVVTVSSASMPPLKHDKDPELSEVLNHIAAELNANGKNEDHAQTVFDVIRQPRRKIIRYSQKSRCWVGVHYQETREGGHND